GHFELEYGHHGEGDRRHSRTKGQSQLDHRPGRGGRGDHGDKAWPPRCEDPLHHDPTPPLGLDRGRHRASARGISIPTGKAGQAPRHGQKCCGVRLRGSALSLYLDTSALIKLLVDEPGTVEARSAYREADGIRTTAIAHVEAIAALVRMRK